MPGDAIWAPDAVSAAAWSCTDWPVVTLVLALVTVTRATLLLVPVLLLSEPPHAASTHSSAARSIRTRMAQN